ncbi:OLC1v1024078C4 [Oldenlandia corymbosa var. corymbosa]|uniref:OLC1v1024078C4 n=1 Tax=Oldenlandia corymbosa var. corymbosa TaxID=529605 RepID=A0AAV1C1V6_OLDCO|nr:OLC1v1024078C4 [Oldenlandia corymbosa var. corymbosa]
MGCHGIVRDSDYPPRIPPTPDSLKSLVPSFDSSEPLVPPRRSLVPAHRSPPNRNQNPFPLFCYLEDYIVVNGLERIIVGLMNGPGVGSIKMYESLKEWSLPRAKSIFDLSFLHPYELIALDRAAEKMEAVKHPVLIVAWCPSRRYFIIQNTYDEDWVAVEDALPLFEDVTLSPAEQERYDWLCKLVKWTESTMPGAPPPPSPFPLRAGVK